ncbi:MAG: DMT family transporter [Clostridia bacterium]|nr:DMT family transporter [Clostridia bacterium]
MSKTLKATICCLLGYSIYGFSFIFTKIALEDSDPNVFLAIRFTLAFLILNLFILFRKGRIELKGKPVMKLLLMGFIQPVIYFICESHGIALTTASFSGIIIGLVPVMGLILGVIFLKESCSLFQIICTVLSVVGVALTTTGVIGKVSIKGLILLLISIVATTVFSILSRSISKEFSAFERSYVMTGLGSISFIAVALFTRGADINAWTEPFKSPSFVWSVLYLAIVSSVIAFTVINYALNYLSVGHTLIFSNFTAVISVIAGILILGDSFTALQLVGVAIIIASVFGVSVYKLKKEQ